MEDVTIEVSDHTHAEEPHGDFVSVEQRRINIKEKSNKQTVVHVVAGVMDDVVHEATANESKDMSMELPDGGEFVRYDGYRDALVGVSQKHLESVEVCRTHHMGRRVDSQPAWRISEKIWTQKPLEWDAEIAASDVTWKESGVQAVSYEVDSRQDKSHRVLSSATKAMDRLGVILFQNQDPGASRDFFTWNDPVDDCQSTHGSLLPLWEVICDKDTHIGVTSFCWHPCDDDSEPLFAVGLGSLNHQDLGRGYACIYSMFDLHIPRYTMHTHAGITCVAFSPDGQFLAMGLHDGGVCIWSMFGPSPFFLEGDIGMYHLFPVWSIRWEATGDVVTVSQDGLEGVWTFDENAIHRVGSRILGMDGSYHSYDPDVFLQNRVESEQVLNMVCCSASSQHGMDIYGTLEGEVLSYSRQEDAFQKSAYHKAPVYSVSVNTFDSEYIMAASLDCSVSVWKSAALDKILLDIDVGEPIVDAQWSPKSSTIFAVATETGNVYVFDISVSKEVPLCQQRVYGSSSLTFVRFHKKHPVIFVGTADGRILCLKLSPNLRCKKENDEAGDFAFLDEEDQAQIYTERPTLGVEEQIEALHDALAHPF